MTEIQESGSNPEVGPEYAAIIIPSYGMSKDHRGYHLTFFSGIVCRAAYEEWKDGIAPKVIVEGSKIFPGDPKNDGDLMKQLLIKLGMPEEAIVQRRDNSNTYDQLLDAKEAIKEQVSDGKVLTIHADLHKLRVPKLVRNYQIDSETAVAEDILGEKYPKFRKVWREIKSDLSYEETEAMESRLARVLKVDPQGKLARLASFALFPFTGADVPDIRHRKMIRYFAKTGRAH